MKPQQSFHDNDFAWAQVLGPDERAGGVLIYRFQDWLAVMQALQLQFEDIEIIAIRMERGDIARRALDSIIFVIVVSAHVGNTVRTEQINQSLCERGLTRRAVSDDAK